MVKVLLHLLKKWCFCWGYFTPLILWSPLPDPREKTHPSPGLANRWCCWAQGCVWQWWTYRDWSSGGLIQWLEVLRYPCWWQPEIRRSPSTSWGKGSWNPILYQVFVYIPGGWPLDFWTINSSFIYLPPWKFHMRYPPGNDHISPIPAGMNLSWWVSFSFPFGRAHGLVPWRVSKNSYIWHGIMR